MLCAASQPAVDLGLNSSSDLANLLITDSDAQGLQPDFWNSLLHPPSGQASLSPIVKLPSDADAAL